MRTNDINLLAEKLQLSICDTAAVDRPDRMKSSRAAVSIYHTGMSLPTSLHKETANVRQWGLARAVSRQHSSSNEEDSECQTGGGTVCLSGSNTVPSNRQEGLSNPHSIFHR